MENSGMEDPEAPMTAAAVHDLLMEILVENSSMASIMDDNASLSLDEVFVSTPGNQQGERLIVPIQQSSSEDMLWGLNCTPAIHTSKNMAENSTEPCDLEKQAIHRSENTVEHFTEPCDLEEQAIHAIKNTVEDSTKSCGIEKQDIHRNENMVKHSTEPCGIKKQAIHAIKNTVENSTEPYEIEKQAIHTSENTVEHSTEPHEIEKQAFVDEAWGITLPDWAKGIVLPDVDGPEMLSGDIPSQIFSNFLNVQLRPISHSRASSHPRVRFDALYFKEHVRELSIKAGRTLQEFKCDLLVMAIVIIRKGIKIGRLLPTLSGVNRELVLPVVNIYDITDYPRSQNDVTLTRIEMAFPYTCFFVAKKMNFRSKGMRLPDGYGYLCFPSGAALIPRKWYYLFRLWKLWLDTFYIFARLSPRRHSGIKALKVWTSEVTKSSLRVKAMDWIGVKEDIKEDTFSSEEWDRMARNYESITGKVMQGSELKKKVFDLGSRL